MEVLVRVHERDNVAVAVDDQKGDVRKVALREIARGEPVTRYGQAIGRALCDIAADRTVDEEMLSEPEAPPLDSLELATQVPAEPEPLSGYTFDGFRNADGSAGTKNLLAITTTVQCVAPTVEYAARRIREETLPRYPNVDGVTAVTHAFGCGVAIDIPGAEIPIRTLSHLSRHPNAGGNSLMVSLGCEKMQPTRLFAPGQAEPPIVRLQDGVHRGFGEMVSAICQAAERRLEELNRRQRTPCPASDLIVGLQCGGSDAMSGVTANPAVGYAADLLVRAGATVMFSEVTEVRDAIHLLTPRCATPDVARALIREMRWYDEYLARMGADRAANRTPGNKRGGLSNIVEKALGSVAKSGTTAIRAVATHGEKVRAKGLVFAATPASDFVCGTQQLASMNLHIFTTGEGTPYSLAMVPVVKISSRTALAERWPDLIDIDAGRIARGTATVEEVGWEIFRFVLDVASGKRKTWGEHWGLANAVIPFHPGVIT